MNQNSVDALLAQIQADASAIKDGADTLSPADAGAAAAVIDGATESLTEIAGDMEPPAPRSADPQAEEIPSGGFAAPRIASLASQGSTDFKRLLAIEVPVIVQLGMRRLTVSEVMRLAVGAIVEFGKSAEEELDLLINNKPVGKGHAVKVGENFGIKITSISPVKETIRKLGAI